MKIQGSAAQHWGFPFLSSTWKRAANSQPSTAGSDFLMTSPEGSNSTNWAEPGQREGNSHHLFCCHIKHEMFGIRGSVTLLIALWCTTAPFETFTLTFHHYKLLHNRIWGAVSYNGHSNDLEGFTQQKKQMKMQRERGRTQRLCCSQQSHHRSANYDNLMLSRL